MPRTRLDPAARVRIDPVWELISGRAASQGVSYEQLAKMSKCWKRSTMYEKMAARSVGGWPELAGGRLLIEKSAAGSLTYDIELPEAVTAPVVRGQQLGVMRVSRGGEVISEIPLTASCDVGRLSAGAIFLSLASSLLGLK